MSHVYQQKYRRWGLFILSFLLTSLAGGLVYGWPALRSQLKADGSILSEKQLGAIFTVGAWATQGGRFFVGLARDRYGTRNIACTCLVLVTLGSIGVALSDPNNVAALSVSLFLIGLGSGVQLCTQPVASLFPKHVGFTLSSLSGAFQISGLVFLALTSGSTRQLSFLIFAGCLVVLNVLAALSFPISKSFILKDDNPSIEDSTAGQQHNNISSNSRKGENETGQQGNTLEDAEDGPSHNFASTDEEKSSQPSNEQVEEAGLQPKEDVEENAASRNSQSELQVSTDASDSTQTNDDEKDNSPTAIQQMKTSEYVLLCAWFSICLVPMQYYVGTIGFQLEEMGDESGFYTDLFSYTYAGAAITAPLSGFVADKCGLGIAQGLATFLVALSLFLLAANEMDLRFQSIGLVSYGIGRMAIFGIFFTNCGKRFQWSNYGTLAGLGLLISALLSLLQYPLIAVASEGHSSLVNTISGVILVAQAPYFVWLHRREKLCESANGTPRRS